MIPVIFHSIIAVFCSAFIFPDTVHSQFRRRFRAVCVPLSRALRSQPALLRTPPNAPEFNAEEYNMLIGKAELALGPLAATARLMEKDLSWGRFGAQDFAVLHEVARLLSVSDLLRY